MPKQTFSNLSNDKQERIKQAVRNEFLKVPFEKASIKHMVEEAKIPRGSFYQYFEDKEDALRYIIYEEMEYVRDFVNNAILSDINIFKFIENIFTRELDHIKRNENSSKANLFKQISNSSAAMEIFTNAQIAFLSNVEWFANKFKAIGLDGEQMEPVIEMTIGALKEAMLSMLNSSDNASMIHNKLIMKLKIIRQGIQNV